MYNDKNRLRGAQVTDPFVGRLSGRSRPSIPSTDGPQAPLESDLSGGRLCDGTLKRNDLRDDMKGCGTADGGFGLPSHPLAMMYSPLQSFHELYSPEEALEHGTLFKELDLPFESAKHGMGGCNLC